MRIAVFSDVHGNLTALEAVLEDMARLAADQIVFAGDLCLVGPRPAACVHRLQRNQGFNIYGNTDDWVLGRQEPPSKLASLADWTLAQLSADQRSWLDALPFAHRISPTGVASDDLLIVHANPVDVNQIIFPAQEEQVALYGRVRQTDDELAELVANTKAGAIAFGHLHIPNERRWQQLKLFNISSVSMPGDGDARAKYGLLSWDGQSWTVEQFKVSYDISQEMEAYRQHQPPGWQSVVRTMASAGSYPQRV